MSGWQALTAEDRDLSEPDEWPVAVREETEWVGGKEVPESYRKKAPAPAFVRCQQRSWMMW